MIWLLLGCAGFGLFFLYDIAGVTGRFRLCRFGFAVGCLLLLAATAAPMWACLQSLTDRPAAATTGGVLALFFWPCCYIPCFLRCHFLPLTVLIPDLHPFVVPACTPYAAILGCCGFHYSMAVSGWPSASRFFWRPFWYIRSWTYYTPSFRIGGRSCICLQNTGSTGRKHPSCCPHRPACGAASAV